MTGLDYAFLALLFGSLIAGLLRGFVREAISVLAWLIGLWVAWHHADLLYPYLGGVLDAPGIREWTARVLMLFGILLLGALIGSLVSWLIRSAAGLAATDRVLGGLFGAVRALVIIGIFVLVGRGLDLNGESWWQRSKLMPYAEYAGNWLERYAEPAVRPYFDSAS